ncbi:MAG TPA: hypothetical protein DDY59_06280 [Lachnospiraceae bacterium]|nr:hypothetical protein [Lachnospiraceae bacterium]
MVNNGVNLHRHIRYGGDSMTMINIAICDDEVPILEFVERKIDHFYLLRNITVNIMKFTNGSSFLDACRSTTFHLVFLDIEMPDLSGIEVVSKLRSVYDDMEIVFLTSYENYVFESFQYRPLRFIRKSKIDSELEEALEAFQKIMDSEKNYYSFFTTDGAVLWRVDDIQYMEAFQHYIYIHRKDKSIKVRGSLDKYEKGFGTWGFIRIHKSYLVSYKHIYSINANEVILTDQKRLPLSRRRNEEVKEKFIKYTRRLN